MNLKSLFGRFSKKGYAPYGPGGSVGYGVLPWLSGSAYDYQREAGRRYDNSIVYTNISFLSRKQSEAVMRLETRDGAGKWKACPTDPISAIFRRPNGFYGESVLWAGLLLSWFVCGNAYLYKVRDQLDQVIGLWYVPHFQIRPRADKYNDDGSKLVTYYEFTPIGGSPEEIPMDDIVHVRCGIDPLRPASGLAPVDAVLREISGDNEAATYSAAMLRNMGVPGVILSPKPLKDGTATFREATPEQRSRMADLWNEYRRDARGGVLALPAPLDVVSPSFDPEKMLLLEVRADAAARICAAFGMDPMVHGLPSPSKTYSNYGEALEAALSNCFLPTMRDIAGQAFDGLKADFKAFLGADPDRYRLGWDFSEVRGLQEDIDALHERWRENFKAGGIDRWTFKERIGEVPEPADKGVYATDLGMADDPEQKKPDPEADPKKKAILEIKRRAQERRRAFESP